MSEDADPPGLEVSERVVWTGPLGTRIGTVRWVGHLPKLRSGLTVGVELDYELPSGGTDGWYDGRFLFRARAKHGRLVAPDELTREDDFFDRKQSNTEEVPPAATDHPPPVLTARERLEDAMARVATEQRVLRARTQTEKPLALLPTPLFGTPLTMLEPPWRVAAANAAKTKQGATGLQDPGSRTRLGAAPGRQPRRRVKAPPVPTARAGTMPAGTASTPTTSPDKGRRAAMSKDASPSRGIMSLIRMFRRRRSLSTERRQMMVSSPPPQRPARASSEDRQFIYRPRKRAAPAPPVIHPVRPSKGIPPNAQNRRSINITANVDSIRHVKGKRKAPEPPLPGFNSLQAQRAPNTPGSDAAVIRSLDRAVSRHPDPTNRQTDTLVLEDGVLRARKQEAAPTASIEAVDTLTNSKPTGTLGRLAAAAGPRLWYKRKKTEEGKPVEQKERRGKKEGKGKQGKASDDKEGELDWLADMVYARQSVAPPDGTIQRRLQVLRHLTDQEERSESTEQTQVTSSSQEAPKHDLKSPGLVRQMNQDDGHSVEQSPGFPDKRRSPLRNLFLRDRSPRDKLRGQKTDTSSSAVKPRFSMLSNFSALDAEAMKLIEGRFGGATSSNAYFDSAATLPSSSQLNIAQASFEQVKSHAQQEKERQETCETIAMLVKEKFDDNAAGTLGGNMGNFDGSQNVEEVNAADISAEEVASKSEQSIENNGSATSEMNESVVEEGSSRMLSKQSEQHEASAANAEACASRESNYPAGLSPFEENSKSASASSGEGHYDNIEKTKKTVQKAENPFENDYPEDQNPFSDDTADISVHYGSTSPVVSQNREQCALEYEQGEVQLNKKVHEARVRGDQSAYGGSLRVSSHNNSDVPDSSSKDFLDTLQDCSHELSHGNETPSNHQNNNSDIPTLVRDLNKFLDSTMQTMSSPKSQRRKARGSATSSLRSSVSPACKNNDNMAALNGIDRSDIKPSEGWPCDRCTLVNKAVLSQCQVCGAKRPDGAGVDWTVEMRKYFTADSERNQKADQRVSAAPASAEKLPCKPTPTERKESLGIVPGGVALRSKEFAERRPKLKTRSLAVDMSHETVLPQNEVYRVEVLSGGDVDRNRKQSVEAPLDIRPAVANGPKLIDAVRCNRIDVSSRTDEDRAKAEHRAVKNGHSFVSTSPPTADNRRAVFQQNRPLSAEVKKRPNLPSTFVSQLLQRESASATATNAAPIPPSPEQDLPDVDEVRRARLAFFAQRARSRSTEESAAASPKVVENTEKNFPLDERSRSSSVSSSAESPTDVDADDESDGSDAPHNVKPRNAEPQLAKTSTQLSHKQPILPALHCAEPVQSHCAPVAPTSPSSPISPTLPAIKEGSPSEYLEEAIANSPPPAPVDHIYEDVEVPKMRSWKLSPAEKARRRPASGSLGRAQWRGDALIVQDGRGGRVKCEVERDPPAPQYVIRDGVLYSQVPTLAELEKRVRAMPNREGYSAKHHESGEPVSRDDPSSGGGNTNEPSSSTSKPSTGSSSCPPSATLPTYEIDGASCADEGSPADECNGFATPPQDVSPRAAVSRELPGHSLESDQGHSELMRDLQRAIDRGHHKQAAFLARKLAALKAEKKRLVGNTILVNLHVEDGTCHVGPMPLQLSPLMSVTELKNQIERDYQLPSLCQRWFIAGGFVSPADEPRSLAETGVVEGSSIHLYLVHPSADAASFPVSARNVTPKMFLRAGSSPPSSYLHDSQLPSHTGLYQRAHNSYTDNSHETSDKRNTKESSSSQWPMSKTEEDVVRDFERREQGVFGSVSNAKTFHQGFKDIGVTESNGKLFEHVDTIVGQNIVPIVRAPVTVRSSKGEEINPNSPPPPHNSHSVEVPPPLPAKTRRQGITRSSTEPTHQDEGVSRNSILVDEAPLRTNKSAEVQLSLIPSSAEPASATAVARVSPYVIDPPERKITSPPPPLPVKVRSPGLTRRKEAEKHLGASMGGKVDISQANSLESAPAVGSTDIGGWLEADDVANDRVKNINVVNDGCAKREPQPSGRVSPTVLLAVPVVHNEGGTHSVGMNGCVRSPDSTDERSSQTKKVPLISEVQQGSVNSVMKKQTTNVIREEGRQEYPSVSKSSRAGQPKEVTEKIIESSSVSKSLGIVQPNEATQSVNGEVTDVVAASPSAALEEEKGSVERKPSSGNHLMNGSATTIGNNVLVSSNETGASETPALNAAPIVRTNAKEQPKSMVSKLPVATSRISSTSKSKGAVPKLIMSSSGPTLVKNTARVSDPPGKSSTSISVTKPAGSPTKKDLRSPVSSAPTSPTSPKQTPSPANPKLTPLTELTSPTPSKRSLPTPRTITSRTPTFASAAVRPSTASPLATPRSRQGPERRRSAVQEKVALFSGGVKGAVGKQPETKKTNYTAHLEAMKQALVPNSERFECPVCMMEVEEGAGVVLRECLHTFCRECLTGTIEHCDTAEVKCPYRDEKYSCPSLVQEIEVKSLVSPELYQRHLSRSLNQARVNAADAFNCRTPNCTGWCVVEDVVNVFNCPVCRKPNCLNCRAIHEGIDCREHQRRLEADAETNEDAKKTQKFLDDMVSRGDALRCPICDVILMKKWGCDWVRCSMCKNEVCWITAQPRWGPGGKGDISGGCKCGVNGKKCHPKCVYCH